jgi:competence protein ComEC
LQRLFRERGIKPVDLAAGDSFSLSREVTARVLFPPRNFSAPIADGQACVLQLVLSSGTRVLLTSDSGIKTEEELLRRNADLRSEILIKGQHHSGESGSEAFLNAVRPRLIIATSSDFPEHERLSDNWVENMRARSIELFRQDETGAVTLRFRRGGWEAQSYLPGKTFRSASQ